MTSIAIHDFTVTSAIGFGKSQHVESISNNNSGLVPCDFAGRKLETYIGRVNDVEQTQLPASLKDFNCRNNKLAYLALQQDDFLSSFNELSANLDKKRIGCLIGTTTSGFREAELAYQNRDQATGKLPSDFIYKNNSNQFSITNFVRKYLDIHGPAFTIGTACSSSAKVFASAARLLKSNVCDMVVVGGVDSLCLNILYGFNALGLVSPNKITPCDEDRLGLSLGEGAAFFILTRNDFTENRTDYSLLGYGESCDAHHLSSPHPEGLGAINAMQDAISMAGLNVLDIDYINMHGTASQVNDRVEDKAIYELFGSDVYASSTKGWTGHTLGAAGGVEASICMLCMNAGIIPGCLNTRGIDKSFSSKIIKSNVNQPIKHILTNSFGFGGNNCSLVIGKN